ncbi:endo-1,3;1,4-beta-D-glucanase-like [Carica papaya]|uniref:endo-1,3;1,4-beta-D-glucanase-like n=1 Tax=Carica papaya TaxID=3649 RepID=UPI000B8CEA45|nr:endo-1,3;1,4-beta-D-glucanase-like [Carica papaya]
MGKNNAIAALLVLVVMAMHFDGVVPSPKCYLDSPVMDPHGGEGHVHKLGGLDTYLVGSCDSHRAVVLVSDVYGFEARNLRKLADKVAAAGYYVAVPDFFHGEPFVRGKPDRPQAEWLADHKPENGFKDAKPLIKALRSKGISAIGAVGICWGGKTAVALGTHELIQAAALFHPSYVSTDEIKGIKVPIAILGAEDDHPDLFKQYGEVLAARPEIDGYVKIFTNVSHGWTMKYDPKCPKAVKRAEEAYQDMLDWFGKHVK